MDMDDIIEIGDDRSDNENSSSESQGLPIIAHDDRTHHQSIDEEQCNDIIEKKPKLLSPKMSQTSSYDETCACVICFDSWTTSGKHRVCSLQCGHLFGRSCIERWLREKGTNGNCPHCNSKARIKDLRNLYVKKLVAVDRSELDKALKDVEIEKRLRKEAEESETLVLVKYQQVLSQLEYTKMELKRYKNLYTEMCKSGVKASTNDESMNTNYNSDLLDQQNNNNESLDIKNSNNGLFKFVSSMKISNTGGCRVSCYNRALGLHVVSKPSPNWNLCPGYGILKINSIEFYSSRTKTEFLRLHSNEIRDIAFSPHNPNQILTVSMDKSIKISNVEINTPMLTYKAGVPVWSCCWDENNSNILYAGLANGSVCIYDIRNTIDVVESMSANSFGFTSNRAPIISIKPIHVITPTDTTTLNNDTDQQNNSSRHRQGLCITALDCLYFVEKTDDRTFPYRFPSIKGSFMCMKVDSTFKHCLFSLRPSLGRNYITHKIGNIESLNVGTDEINNINQNDISSPVNFKVTNEFNGGNSATQMCRSCFVNIPNQDVPMVVSGDEASKSFFVWNMLNRQQSQYLSHDKSTILDIESFSIGQYSFISTLSESSLSVYRWSYV